ncbi:hypothetical protein J2W44_006187 [Priestia aryabhattai]|jgi:hypothetical protein|nr:hypothetical protein [Bacillus sp. PvP124]MDH6656794.1 hypothetical protein [Bacillus sp. PvP124]MDP9580685.1 hypothetical protein [Bacillus sp. 1751]MDP9727027.1 hypothetical protein [Priestia aryabhattai]
MKLRKLKTTLLLIAFAVVAGYDIYLLLNAYHYGFSGQ